MVSNEKHQRKISYKLAEISTMSVYLTFHLIYFIVECKSNRYLQLFFWLLLFGEGYTKLLTCNRSICVGKLIPFSASSNNLSTHSANNDQMSNVRIFFNVITPFLTFSCFESFLRHIQLLVSEWP